MGWDHCGQDCNPGPRDRGRAEDEQLLISKQLKVILEPGGKYIPDKMDRASF